MKALVGCEYSQEVTKALRNVGVEAYSCDLLPTEGNPDWHYQCDVSLLLNPVYEWDLGVFFPSCTYLCSSGARWMAQRQHEQKAALEFVLSLMNAPIERIAIENPIGVISTKIRKPDQIIQPWMFGHGETKATCLWLKNLPLLRATEVVSGREPRIWKESPGKDRWKRRSRTYTGIAKAMATQWGKLSTIQHK